MSTTAEGQPSKAPSEEKLSPAELKKRAKAEKQARRAAQKEQATTSEITANVASSASAIPPAATAASSRAAPQPNGTSQPRQAPRRQPEQGNQNRRESTAPSEQTSLPTRRRPSHSGPPAKEAVKVKREDKRIELFSHLYSQSRRHTLDGTPKDIHPAVVQVGLQMSNYEICGSTARCLAMLRAFREAIQSYHTPAGTSLARHLTSHYLSPQIEYLKSCRPISESMGNAIRFLKKRVIEIDPSVDDEVAKASLCDDIDTFIRERITITDQAIAAVASKQIKPGAVVLTYAKSSLVEKTILHAVADGIDFTVVVVDSRPLHEGRSLARSLAQRGIEVQYVPLSGAAHAMREASVVLLGAHSMLSNGRLHSRIGTATIAMLAKKVDVPVIVCCESLKFSGKVALDSIVLNEVAPSEELLPPHLALSPLSTTTTTTTTTPSASEADHDIEAQTKTLASWREVPNLQLLNLMYDVTPAEYIRMVICEYGSLPSSSVSVVHSLANQGEP